MQTQSDSLLTRLKELECPDSTYPARNPALVMARALGSVIEDVDHRQYIDLVAGFGVLALGHNPSALQKALKKRCQGGLGEMPPITQGMGDVFPSVAKVHLIETLLGILPKHLKRAAVALTGGQAVEIAVKTAILSTKKNGFLVFDESYHGLDLGILPLTGLMNFKEPFQGYLPSERVESVPFGSSESHVIAACEKLANSPYGFAAIVVEPVQGRAGVIPAPEGWLGMLRQVADRFGALLIFDEIFTGLGRTGRLTFAEEVPCDLLCLGKALGGGLPLSACIGTEKAMLAWPESNGEALHTGTFFGHALSCEVAADTLRDIIDQDLPQRACDLGIWCQSWLRRRLDGHPTVKEIRGVGLMLAIDFKAAGLGAALMDRLRGVGVISLASGSRGESLSLTPPLNIPQDLLEDALTRIVGCLSEKPFVP